MYDEDSDQIGQLTRLIPVFYGQTNHNVSFVKEYFSCLVVWLSFFSHTWIYQSSKKDQKIYRYDPKFGDRYVWANSADPDQTAPRGAVKQSDQGLYCLLFHLHLFDEIGLASLFEF